MITNSGLAEERTKQDSKKDDDKPNSWFKRKLKRTHDYPNM